MKNGFKFSLDALGKKSSWALSKKNKQIESIHKTIIYVHVHIYPFHKVV